MSLDRRKALRMIGAVVVGAAFAPAVKQIAQQVLADDPPPSRQPRVRWIGHF
ncbi:MAG TPA: hypothetical protein VL463_20435 [Kofleriaceae bacterium]|jgi:hypothetical protein|nr:hypothetical protein [Kofleriaceae bacterium]